MLRYTLGAIAAAAAASATCLLGMFLIAWIGGGQPSSEDVAGFAAIAFVSTLLLIAILHVPVYVFGRRRWGWSRRKAVAVAALALNAPAYLMLLFGLVRGGMFGGPSEVLLFAIGYFVAAIVFTTAAP